MEKIQLRLVICGLSIILLGFLYGLFHAYSTAHTPRMSSRDDYQGAFAQLAEQSTESSDSETILGKVERVSSRSVKHQRAIGAHTHAIYLGLLISLTGLFLGVITTNLTLAKRIALAISCGVLIYPLGLATQAAGFILAGEALALLGSLLVICCVSVITWISFRL